MIQHDFIAPNAEPDPNDDDPEPAPNLPRYIKDWIDRHLAEEEDDQKGDASAIPYSP